MPPERGTQNKEYKVINPILKIDSTPKCNLELSNFMAVFTSPMTPDRESCGLRGLVFHDHSNRQQILAVISPLQPVTSQLRTGTQSQITISV